ncbi:hypothetical protein [Blastomonas sp.]|uniref:hypothetical protein n=1 Tax=Blastomonas sp. TaxID=1909299 RepID=UPI00391AF766
MGTWSDRSEGIACSLDTAWLRSPLGLVAGPVSSTCCADAPGIIWVDATAIKTRVTKRAKRLSCRNVGMNE